MTDSTDGHDHPTGQGRLPRNRARLVIVSVFLLMLVVAFGFMIIVGN